MDPFSTCAYMNRYYSKPETADTRPELLFWKFFIFPILTFLFFHHGRPLQEGTRTGNKSLHGCGDSDVRIVGEESLDKMEWSVHRDDNAKVEADVAAPLGRKTSLPF